MRGRQPRPWHADGRRPERSHQAAFPMAVAGAGSPLRRSCAALASPFIAVAPQGQVQFRFKQLLDEAADPAANPSFQGIEPVITKKMSSLGGINRCLRVIRRHGVISVGVPTPILFAFTSWRLRHLQISTTLATPPSLRGNDTPSHQGESWISDRYGGALRGRRHAEGALVPFLRTGGHGGQCDRR